MNGVFFVGVAAMILFLAAVGGIVWYFYMKLRYKTVGPNEALIITGPKLGKEDDPSIFRDENGRYLKVVRGGGHLLKMFQHPERISLKSFQLYIQTPEVYTEQKVKVYAKATATVKVAESLGGIARYSEQFLGKEQSDIEYQVEKVLDTHVRAILSKMSVEDINSNLDAFNSKVKEIAAGELARMGFEITSLGLSSIEDEDGYLENLGKPQVAEVQKIAEIAEAESRKESELKKAEVQEQIAKEKYQRETSIAEAKKEKDLNDAKILAETERERAISEASYQLEQEQRRLVIEKQRLEIREQEKINELKLREMERENEVKLQEREVSLEKQRVEVRKQQADAEYYVKTREAEADAEAKKLAGQADAEVIRSKADAEVQALKERAEAMNQFKDVLITEKVIEMLPEYAKAISSSLSNVESIRIMDGGNGNQIKSLPSSVTSMMTNMNEGLNQMAGLDLNSIIKNATGKNFTLETTTNQAVPKQIISTDEEHKDE